MNNTPDNGVSIKKIVVKGFFWMFLAGILVNVTQFIIKIILARLLSPSDFGIMAIAISIISFVGFFQELGLSTALVQRKKDVEEAFNTVFVFMVFASIFYAVIIFLASNYLSIFFNDASLKNVLRLIAITLPLGAYNTAQFSHLAKNLLFFRRFIAETLPILFGGTTSLILAVYGLGYISLVVGYVISSIVYVLIMVFLTKIKLKFCFNFKIFKELFQYSKYIFFVNIAAIILSQGDNFIVGKFLGSAQLGYYALAYTLATLPALNISHVASRVLFPVFAELQDDKNNLKKSFVKSIELMSILIFPIALGAIIVSPFLFTNILGPKWLPAQSVFIILAIVSIFKSILVIPSFYLEATGYSKAEARIIFYAVILQVLIMVPLTLSFGIVGMSFAMLIVYFCAVVKYIFKCLKIIEISVYDLGRCLFPALLASFIMVLIGVGIMVVSGPIYNLWNMVILISVCVISYVITLFIVNKSLLIEVKFLFSSFIKKQA